MVFSSFAPFQKVKETGRSLRPQDFQLMSAVFCILVFLSGVFTRPSCESPPVGEGKTPVVSTATEGAVASAETPTQKSGSSEENASCQPDLWNLASLGGGLFAGSLYALLITGYVEGAIKSGTEDQIQDLEEATKDVQRERLEVKRTSVDSLRTNLELDFLYAFSEATTQSAQEISTEGLSQRISELKTQARLDQEIKQHHQNRQHAVEAIAGIQKGFERLPNGRVFWSVAIVEACNTSLGLDPTVPESLIEEFYDDMRGYLKAWLVTSLRWGDAIPIIPSVQLTLRLPSIQAERYQGYRSYIKAIDVIQTKALRTGLAQKLFPTPEAKAMVNQYLDELKELLLEAKDRQPQRNVIPS